MNRIITMQEVIDHYSLTPHIEGGFYQRTYHSSIIVPKASLPYNFNGNRSLSSTILYLVPSNIKSKLHRLKGDEIWHFYLGDPFILIELHENDELRQTILGNCSLYEQKVQHLVPSGCWFGGYVSPKEKTYSFSLVGCTIFPSFNEDDFELGERRYLIDRFPQYSETILQFF